MKWYYADSVDSECWAYGGESRDEAIEAALKCERNPDEGLPFIQLSSFAIAHESTAPESISDRAFWDAVASCIADWACLDSADERLCEDSLTNPEEPFLLTDGNAKKIEAALAAVLPLVLERPDWRCIESPQEVTPAGRAITPPPSPRRES